MNDYAFLKAFSVKGESRIWDRLFLK